MLSLAAAPPAQKAETDERHGTEGVEARRQDTGFAPQQLSETKLLDPGCPNGQENRASDLCAQWKAADAAGASATWALWSFLTGGLGLLIGGGTLLAAWRAAHWARKAADYTEQGAEAAVDGIIETRRIGEIQVRAYLSVVGADFHIGRGQQTDPNFPTFELTLHLHNSGQTPAVNVSYFCTSNLSHWGNSSLPPITKIRSHQYLNNVTPGERTRFNATCYGIAVEWRNLVEKWSTINNDTKLGDMPLLKIYGILFYDDIFGQTHYSKFCFTCDWWTEGNLPLGKDGLEPLQTTMPSFVPIADRMDFNEHGSID